VRMSFTFNGNILIRRLVLSRANGFGGGRGGTALRWFATTDRIKIKYDTLDGCTACTHVAYGMSDTSFIFPITPSSPMAELAEQWSEMDVKNVFGDKCKVMQLQSEAGAAGSLHGALTTGSLGTTFTASQGLLLMVPNMYKISGELLPCVIHVAARAIAGSALSIFGDHQDIMAVRATGFAILGGSSVQEAGDFAAIAHLATLRARVPFVHYLDGFVVSHNIEKVNLVPYSTLKKLMDKDAIRQHHERALNPLHPHLRGTNQNQDVYFQNLEASNKFYDATPGIVKEEMQKFAQETGRKYDLFDWYGPLDAKRAIVAMGSGGQTIKEAVDYLANTKGEKVGLLIPRLFRPWSSKDFLDALPTSVDRLAVLDRTKEAGSSGEPLYLDVAATLQDANRPIKIIRGRYGLGQKMFDPTMAISIYEELQSVNPKSPFTIGIEDDVTHLSLPITGEKKLKCLPEGTTECLIYGFGSDGTVGANKNAIKIIGDNTELFPQGAFQYGSSKAGGLTLSHLRFGPSPRASYYGVTEADYLGCHNPQYVETYRLADNLRKGGVFCLNSPWNTIEELDKHLPSSLKRGLADKQAKIYNVDAFKVATEQGMGRMINTVMQSAFFKLSGVLDYEKAIELFKNAIKKTYGAKGEAVVQKNFNMVDSAIGAITGPFEIPAQWSKCDDSPLDVETKLVVPGNQYVTEIVSQMTLMKGDNIPVSTFPVGGVMPMGTTKYEKRAFALEVPEVDMDKCTQCNYCAYTCPHAVIRPFLLSQDEADVAPATFDYRKAKGGAEAAGLNFRIQVSAADCTGCAVCVNACPDDALRMVPMDEVPEHGHFDNWDFAMKLPDRSERFDINTVKGSQFYQPLLEFHGACAGCGETPYAKLLTQLFGQRLIIANATGCSSIWGAPYGSNPYSVRTVDQKGPAWGNSLFEDAAEYGLGMAVAVQNRRGGLKRHVLELLLEGKDSAASPALYSQLDEFVNNFDNWKVCNRLADSLPALLKAERSKDPLIATIADQADLIPKLSMWTVGGDGWAYDIGFGGLDHSLASGLNLNILVLDTEVYSNTGGQTSKSTPMGAIAKFSTTGRGVHKKDLADIITSYGNVYVANVSMGANYQQTMKAFVEAEAWNGPSLIIAYSPCIEHKNTDGMSDMVAHQQAASHSGYYPLWRYNPARSKDGKNPFQLDTKKLTVDVKEVLANENRFGSLKRSNPDKYEALTGELRHWIDTRHRDLVARAVDHGSAEGEPLLILYGSETGNTEELAFRTGDMCRSRGYGVQVMECDEMDPEELPSHPNVMFLLATCGEGDFPKNCATLYEQLSRPDAFQSDHLKNTQFAVFALGDSSYHEFCKVGKDYDAILSKLGAQRIQDVGLGNDQDADKFETAFEEWLPLYYTNTNAPPPADDHLIPAPLFETQIIDSDTTSVIEQVPVVHPGAQLVPVVRNDRLTPSDYDRIIRHICFDTRDERDLPFLLGDVLNIMPKNDPARVKAFLKDYGLDPETVLRVTPTKAIDQRRQDAYVRPRSLEQIFTEVVDILGRPNKYFYKNLSRFAVDEKEKNELELIASDGGKEKYAELVEETVTYVDVLNLFPSARPTVEHLLSIIPSIKPRLYSIASSQRYNPNEAELMIVILDWKSKSGKQRRGLSTDYVERLQVGDQVAANITSGTFLFPEDARTPMVMAGLGTGLAPFRAFTQERKWMRDRGVETGPMWLFYGCRYKAKEFAFGDELEQFAKEGVITELRPAFSRDQKEKIYVQTRISEVQDRMYEDLITKKGFFYLCGQAGETETAILDALKKSFEVEGKMTTEQAQKEWEKIHADGRYCPELY